MVTAGTAGQDLILQEKDGWLVFQCITHMYEIA